MLYRANLCTLCYRCRSFRIIQSFFNNSFRCLLNIRRSFRGYSSFWCICCCFYICRFLFRCCFCCCCFLFILLFCVDFQLCFLLCFWVFLWSTLSVKTPVVKKGTNQLCTPQIPFSRSSPMRSSMDPTELLSEV
jgi:hypothetical protein